MTKKHTITMDDVARLARVSKPTVSRALSDSPLVKQDTKDRVISIAREHGYAVNRNAQKLRHKRTNTIAVSLDFRSHQENHISDPFIFDLLAGVSEALGELSQDLLLCAPNHNDVESFSHILSSRGADGFIVLGQGHREDMLGELAQSGAPFVVWGAGNRQTPYCVVGSDNFLGGMLAGQYLLDKNRSRFLFVGDTSFKEIYLRRAGLQKAVEVAGGNTTFYDVVLSNFSFESAFAAATNFLAATREPPDAVFAFSDTAAMAFIHAFRAAGLDVPGQVSVVGYNDIPSAAYFSPPVTTIRQDIYQAGRLLVSNLMRMLDGLPVRSSTIKTELIVRET
ncbi:MAG: LacI family DNA-binding transcriptional regulator [Woeseiaceae bacterium]|nr:LacI family DNA-binding transcriptional regulator [Woeseiaceae bacterium]